MTRAELRTRVLYGLNDSPTAPVFWRAAEIDTYIQEAQEVLAEDTPAWKRTFLIPRREGTTIYQLPGIGADIMAPYRVWMPDKKIRLEAKTFADLDARHERWWEVTGTQPWWWAPVSWDQFLIWPPPTTGEGWLEVDCYVWPPALLDDGDVVEFHESNHEVLEEYAQGLGYLKQWDAQGCVQRLQRFLTRANATRGQSNVRQVQDKAWQRGAQGDDRRR